MTDFMTEEFIWIVPAEETIGSVDPVAPDPSDSANRSFTDYSKGGRSMGDDWGSEISPRQPAPARGLSKGVRLRAADLEEKMTGFLQIVGRIFQQAQAHAQHASRNQTTQMQLEEVELAVEISAEGEVKMLAGISAGGKGAITLKFKRVPSPPNLSTTL